MTRLLVGGDSFATWDETHWCKSLAESVGSQVHSTGIAGKCIKYTILNTIAHLENSIEDIHNQDNRYTHCIFHLTSFLRLTSIGADDTMEKKLEILEDLSTVTTKRWWKEAFNLSRHLPLHSTVEYKDRALEDPFYYKSFSVLTEAENMMHIGALIGYCNFNKIKLCIRTVFNEDIKLPNFGPVDHFTLHDGGGHTDNISVVYKVGNPHHDIKGHYTAKQHELLLQEFQRLFPGWLETDV